MITVLVSSKTMKPGTPTFEVATTAPKFGQQAMELDTKLKTKSALQLRRLMHISPKLADATKELITNWQNKGGTPAWYTFVGDVYKGLQIKTFSQEDIAFAQQHCFTISGLYGMLRPLDAIVPYRLEMMYKLTGKGYKNLYEFWGDTLAKEIPKGEIVVNLSSEEYIKTLRPHVAPGQIITPWFYQQRAGKNEFHAVHAKNARGSMTRWICKNRIEDPARLPEFGEDRYAYVPELSTVVEPVFVREFIPVAMQR